jgi:NADP-dependent 3-hydroxy acid dehydrogenase YdfG
MSKLAGKVAWITGAGTGIGEATALALAGEGAEVIVTGRRREPLESVAKRIKDKGGKAHVQPADMMDSKAVAKVADFIKSTCKRLDILVANAGLNIRERDWSNMTPEGADQVIGANLNSAFYCALAVLPMMRAQKDGVIIITASMAGRGVSLISGAAYTAAKHGVVAAAHSINMQECIHGVRCTAVLPGEVATPILDKRPVPVTAEERAKMVQSEDVGDLMRYIACLPPHVCLNEIWITPTWNRGYVAGLQRRL